MCVLVEVPVKVAAFWDRSASAVTHQFTTVTIIQRVIPVETTVPKPNALAVVPIFTEYYYHS